MGQWSRWSAIDKGWFLLKRRTFHMHVHTNALTADKNKNDMTNMYRAAGERRFSGHQSEQNAHSCHFLFGRLGLFFFAVKGDSSRHACPRTQIHHCRLVKSSPHATVDREGNVQTPSFLVPTLGQDPFDSFVVFSQQ